MAPSLKDQLKSHEEQAVVRNREVLRARQQLEQSEATLATTLRSSVAASLDWLAAIRSLSDNVLALPQRERESAADDVMRRYGAWLDDAVSFRRLIDDCSRLGINVVRGDEILHAMSEVEILLSRAGRIRSAARNLDDGRGIGLEEAMNELRRRAGAGST